MGRFIEALKAEIRHFKTGEMLPRDFMWSALCDSTQILRPLYEDGSAERPVRTSLGLLTVRTCTYTNDYSMRPTVSMNRVLVLSPDTGTDPIRCEEGIFGIQIKVGDRSAHGQERMLAAEKMRTAVSLAKQAIDLAA